MFRKGPELAQIGAKSLSLKNFFAASGRQKESKMNQKVGFGDPEGFLSWLNQGGKVVEFPLGPKGWSIQIGPQAEDTKITSSFYEVKSRPPYGAWRICGILFPFGGEMACGVITLGFDADGKPAVTNRRRTTAADNLPDGQILVGVVEPTPDRVEEPAAVCIHSSDIERIRALTAEEWLAFYDIVRDGPELCAVRAVRRFVK